MFVKNKFYFKRNQIIGEGVHGPVYKGFDSQHEGFDYVRNINVPALAIKRILIEKCSFADSAWFSRLGRSLQKDQKYEDLLIRLEHPNIVKLVHVEEDINFR